jgi:septum formation protein
MPYSSPVRLVLASASPRRLELLLQLGVVPARTFSPDIDETPERGETPRLYAIRMAVTKAEAVQRAHDETVLAGDTVVAVGRRVLGKAEDEAEVARFLNRLSGRRHDVFSAICLLGPGQERRTRLSASKVRFKRLTDAEIERYAKSGEGVGKAGGYALQGKAAGLIDWMQGSYSGIVGLPLFETRALLESAGIELG